MSVRDFRNHLEFSPERLEEIENRLARLISMIEPIILVVLGGVIACLLYAFYLPLFELTKGAQ